MLGIETLPLAIQELEEEAEVPGAFKLMAACFVPGQQTQ